MIKPKQAKLDDERTDDKSLVDANVWTPNRFALFNFFASSGFVIFGFSLLEVFGGCAVLIDFAFGTGLESFASSLNNSDKSFVSINLVHEKKGNYFGSSASSSLESPCARESTVSSATCIVRFGLGWRTFTWMYEGLRLGETRRSSFLIESPRFDCTTCFDPSSNFTETWTWSLVSGSLTV